MSWFKKAKISFAFLLGSALFAANEAHAMKISELEKLPLRDQAAYAVQVIDAHLALVADKDVDLFKKTEIAMYSPSSVNKIYQGVVDIIANSNRFAQKGYADKVDVELVCRLVMDSLWKEKGWTHDGQIANSSQFFQKGFQVAYNPPKQDGAGKNAAAPQSDKGTLPKPAPAK